MSKPLYQDVSKVTRIPRAEIEKRENEERRAEIGMLKILMQRYRDEAEKFRQEIFRRAA